MDAAPPSTADQSTSAPNGAAAPSGSQVQASQLPPEALDLASRLFDMSRRGSLESLLPYLDAGIPLNMRNSTGDTFLMLSSYHNHPQLVHELLRRGADPSILNDKGQSPLAGAVFKGHTEIVKLLVEEGKADIRAGKPDAVSIAAMFKRWDCADIMGVRGECEELAPALNPVGARDVQHG